MTTSNISNINLTIPGEGNPIEKAFLAFLNNGSTVQLSSLPSSRISSSIIYQTSTSTINSFVQVEQRTVPVPVVFTGYLGILLDLQTVLPVQPTLPAPAPASSENGYYR